MSLKKFGVAVGSAALPHRDFRDRFYGDMLYEEGYVYNFILIGGLELFLLIYESVGSETLLGRVSRNFSNLPSKLVRAIAF